MAGEARAAKAVYEATTLAASAARTATGNTQATPVRLPVAPAYTFILDQTNAADAAGDTLDVFIQTLLDGTNWVDVVHFTQSTGDGTDALRYVSKIAVDLACAEFETGTSLGAAAVRNLAGDSWAVRWAIANGGGAHSFTFSVTAVPA